MKQLLGNEPIRRYLEKALESSTLPHTLLFSGPSGIGKSLFAKELARRLLQTTEKRIAEETHPDLHLLRPEGKSGTHAIEQVRELIDEVHKPPFEAPRKVFLLFEAERMLPAAGNALLKTLEEPALDCQILLLSSAPQEILPTILSRAVHLVFQPLAQEDVALFLREKGAGERAEQIARLSNGSLGAALSLLDKPEGERAQQLLFDALERKMPPFQAIEAIEALFDDLEGVDYHRQADQLLAAYLMWVRDQHLRQVGGPPSLLYFPAQQGGRAVPSLSEAQTKAAQAKMALDRNTRLSACLDLLISH